MSEEMSEINNTEKEKKMTRQTLLQTICELRKYHSEQVARLNEWHDNNKLADLLKKTFTERQVVLRTQSDELREQIDRLDRGRHEDMCPTINMFASRDRICTKLDEDQYVLELIEEWEKRKQKSG